MTDKFKKIQEAMEEKKATDILDNSLKTPEELEAEKLEEVLMEFFGLDPFAILKVKPGESARELKIRLALERQEAEDEEAEKKQSIDDEYLEMRHKQAVYF